MSELGRVIVDDDGALRVVAVSGEIDASNAASVGEDVVHELPNSALAVVLDLTKLDYIDSAGVAVIFDIGDRLVKRGQRLVLVVPCNSLIRLSLEVTQVDTIAAIEQTLEAARARVLRDDDSRTA